MKTLIFFIFFKILFIHGYNYTNEEIELSKLQGNLNEIFSKSVNETINVENFGFILNQQSKKFVKNVIDQMPCGWPAYGIPPIAPYTNENLKIRLVRNFITSFQQLIRFKFEGLDDMEIKKIQVSFLLNKSVKFHVHFKRLRATAINCISDSFIDLMKKLGFSIRYDSSGPLDITLHHLSIQGSFKYTMPIFFGSVTIYKLNTLIKLNNINFYFGGFMNLSPIDKMINEQIEFLIPHLINSNNDKINVMLKEHLVPRLNKLLVGKNFWDFMSSMDNTNNKCIPTPSPWSNIK